MTLAVVSLDAAGPDMRLPHAARAGDRATVNALLAAGASVDSTEPDGTSALHWAVYRDDPAMTERLLTAGADANHANRSAAIPLTLACTNGSAAIVDLLLAAGADPNAAPSGAPALITCAAAGAETAVRALLTRGADVNATDTFRRQTPLMWAAAENHAAIIKLLLESGAIVDARSRGDFTALMFAVRQDAREAARLLVDAGADVNFTAANAQTALRLAINNRHYALASTLLDAGAWPDTRDKQGNTPLHELVTSRSLQRYAANPTSASGPAAGSAAPAQMGSLDLMKKLVAWGADPNARTEAARVVHEKWTDKGIYSASRPFMDNSVNMGGATPYLLAAQAADVDAMRLLQTLGSDPHAVTSANNTAVLLAAGVGYVEGSRRYRPERDALEAVRLAVSAGIDVNAANANGQTALHGAVYRAANTIIRYLVRAGARTDVSDELDRTPLKLAEQGFNQVASLIRRDSAAALLRELGATPGQATASPVPDAR